MSESASDAPVSSAELPLSLLKDAVRPELETLAIEVVEKIRAQVPELAGLFEGTSGDHARQGFVDFFDEFIDGTAVREATVPGSARRTHRAFVTRAFLEGRTLSGLLAAYQVGARTVWNRLSLTGRRASATPDQMYLLAKILFDRLDETSTASAEIFKQLQREPADLLKDRRRRLVRLLVQEAAPSTHGLPELAGEALWRIPERAACVALGEEFDRDTRMPPGLDSDVLFDFDRPDPFLLVPAPDLPGRDRMLRRALGGVVYALGPTVGLNDAVLSLRLARRALALARDGVLPTEGGGVRCDDHLAALQLFGDEGCLKVLMDKALAAFSEVTPERRARLSETLMVWLSTGSSLPEIADRLRVHPQTVRYRMRQIEALFGADLYDPGWRFEMALALHGWRLNNVRTQHQKTRRGPGDKNDTIPETHRRSRTATP